ncbi:hypothetical protein J2128_001790 [Methanomicrobium sp. W14]|nr:hypothetical protein [Methanomicrobium sp. W14]
MTSAENSLSDTNKTRTTDTTATEIKRAEIIKDE